MLGTQAGPTKSRQLYHLDLKGGTCELSAPDVRLSAYIDYYWLLSVEQASLVLEVIPDTAVDLVMSPDMSEFAALYFPVSEKFEIKLEGPIQYTGICFRSMTASEILHHELSTLAQLTVGSDVIQNLNIDSLLADIKNLRTLGQLTKRFDSFWLARTDSLAHPKEMKSRINHRQLIDLLEDSVGSKNISHVCGTLGVSERQFRRLSNDLFGISPKKLQNVLRLQSALQELIQADKRMLLDLYYDDSHRIRELKRLTGCTPGQIRQMAEKYNKQNSA